MFESYKDVEDKGNGKEVLCVNVCWEQSGGGEAKGFPHRVLSDNFVGGFWFGFF